MSDLSITAKVDGMVEVGNQINQTTKAVKETASGMGNIIQQAKQYFNQVTQAKNIDEQKEREFNNQRIERINKEREARLDMIRELEKEKGKDDKSEAHRRIMIAKEKSHLESLKILEENVEKKISPDRPGSKIPGFLKGKVVRYGGMIAGAMGAYSAFSKLSEGMGVTENVSDELAKQMITLPKGTKSFGAVEKLFTQDIKSTLEELGQVSLISAKDMQGMIGALRETGKVTAEEAKNQIQIANEAKRMNIDPAVSGQIQQQMLRYGAIQGSPEFLMMQRRLGGREGMSQRVEEMLKVQQQTVEALSRGATQGGGRNIENLLKLLDTSGMSLYTGEGGGQLLQSVDQAFRGGGSEAFELFQYQAMSPLAQERNKFARRNRTTRAGGKLGSGLYDAYIADQMQEFGAFATPASMIEQYKKLNPELATYIEKKYKGDLNRTSIERVIEQFKVKYGEGEGEQLRFEQEFAKEIGMEGQSLKIAALLKVLGGKGRKDFLSMVGKKGFSDQEAAEYASAIDKGDKAAIKKLEGKASVEEVWAKIGQDLNLFIKDNRGWIVDLVSFLKEGTEVLKNLSGFLKKYLGDSTEEEKAKLGTTYVSSKTGALIDKYGKKMNWSPEEIRIKKEEIAHKGGLTGIGSWFVRSDKEQQEAWEFSKTQSEFNAYRARQTNISDAETNQSVKNYFVKANELVDTIKNLFSADKTGKNLTVNLNTPGQVLISGDK